MNDEQHPDSERIQQSFRVCRDEIKHEYGVLANRLNSYFTSQAFLVSGYAISMGNMNSIWGGTFRLMFPLLLCIVGVLLSIRAMPGIRGVCIVIEHWHKRQSELFKTGSSALEDYSVLKHETVKNIHDSNLWFAQTSTWIFGSAWVVMAALALYLHSLTR